MLADVERFRTVNDALRRQAGDALLKRLGDRLSLVAGNNRSARLSQDTFALLRASAAAPAWSRPWG